MLASFSPLRGFVREPICYPGSIEPCTVNLKHLENSCIALCQSQGFQKGIICRCFNNKILQNHNFWTFWIILFILIDLKHVENNFIELLWSQGFQKGIICRGFNDKILQNYNFWTFWIILFILIDLKHLEQEQEQEEEEHSAMYQSWDSNSTQGQYNPVVTFLIELVFSISKYK